MSSTKSKKDQAFGVELGIASANVSSYSSDYDQVDENEYPERRHFRSYVDGIYMGYKWQCVEFARRWLYKNNGQIFNDIPMAYDIFKLKTIRDIKNNQELPLNSFKNGSKRWPEPGAMLIWNEGGEFENTGHVAIITEVFEGKVHIAEQNMDFQKWPEGQTYAREIKSKVGKDGDYWLHCPSGGSNILGWVIQTEDITNSVGHKASSPTLLNIAEVSLSDSKYLINEPWLNLANDDELAYVNMMGGHKLVANEANENLYYKITSGAEQLLESSTDELHQMFMHATDYVLDHPALLAKFGLPKPVLSKIRNSWANRKNQLITSRFDFAMSEEGLKVYEYNCDSASCYMEAGKIQGKWLNQINAKGGVDAGESIFKNLVDTWKRLKIDSIIHILQDDDPEETYHALFMKNAIEAAGYECLIVSDLAQLHIAENGAILDINETAVKWVWKTWAWETALDELRFDSGSGKQAANQIQSDKKGIPSLSDVLLNDDIMVFEPLWTLIPSNKAILPVLWSLFPNHPLLLNCDFALNDVLLASGYVSKPIVGRCGSNIELVDSEQQTIEKNEGSFGDREQVYQQLFPLPKIDRLYVQICTFTASGNYIGACTRADTSMIIGKDSDCLALQVAFD